MVESDTATVLGTKIVVDYQGVTMAHVAQANPTLFKKLIAVSQVSVIKDHHQEQQKPWEIKPP